MKPWVKMKDNVNAGIAELLERLRHVFLTSGISDKVPREIG